MPPSVGRWFGEEEVKYWGPCGNVRNMDFITVTNSHVSFRKRNSVARFLLSEFLGSERVFVSVCVVLGEGEVEKYEDLELRSPEPK